jgi:AcrR family transcriptional regulator
MIKHPHTIRSEQRHAQLEQSLLQLLREKPYPRITVADICCAARIPRRTFYHYFDSKEAVLRSLIENMIRRCSIQVMVDFQGDYNSLLESLVRNFRYWRDEGRTMLEVLMDNNLEGELVTYGLKWLREEEISLTTRPDLSEKQLEIATTASVASFFSILHYWRSNGYQETPEEMAEYTAWFLAEPLFRV